MTIPKIYFLLLALSVGPVGTTVAQPAAPPTDLSVTATNYVQYPSLNSVTAISIHLGTYGTHIYDIVQKRVNSTTWNCASPEFYKVVVVDSSQPQKVLRQLDVMAVRLIGKDPNGARYTHCEGNGHPAIVDLILGSQVNSGDLIKVFVYDDTGQTNPPLISSDGKLPITTSSFPTFTATPQAAPGEALNNGATRTVGQLNIAFSDANLIKDSPINLYVKSSDLISTDGKDSKSAVSITAGIQRGLLSKWYSPYHFEQILQGNQTAKNLSTVTSLGFAADPPWLWTKHILNNSFILAPLPPEPSISNQYTHRFEQLVTKKTPLLSVNDYSLNPTFSWSTISFPFTCRLLFWETSQSPKASSADATAATAPQTSTCLGAELNFGLWYLPLDLTSAGSERVEGYGDISILIPLSDFSVASKELTYVTAKDPTKFQVRIKYADSVNTANNYARTKQWTFGIEALK
jgi:hypothetical protein